MEAPPLRERWGYEVFGRRLPAEYRAWAERDINGRWWYLKRLAVVGFPLLLMTLLFTWLDGWRWSRLAFVPGVVLVLAVSAKRERALALRRQDPDQVLRPPLSAGQKRAVAAMCAVAAVAIALVVVFRDPLNEAVHPDRCTSVPAATQAAITEAADPGASFEGFQQRRHTRWTGIAVVVRLGANRTVATWVEDRSVTPHRISPADTYAAARTPDLPPLVAGPDFTDAVSAARSALTCPLR